MKLTDEEWERCRNENSAGADEGPAIDMKPGRCGGEPCLAGTRIAMSHLQGLVEMGWSYARICSEYPHVSRARMLEALCRWMHATNWRD